MALQKRVLYSSQSVFTSPGVSGGLTPNQLHRVLSLNHGDAVTRQDVTVFGQRAPIDQVAVEAPTSSLDISYLVTDGHNESALGLLVNSTGVATGSWLPCLNHIIDGTRDEQNYFIKVMDQSLDADLASAAGITPLGVMSFGNGSLGSYSVEARVGGFPTASVRVAGLNLRYKTGVSAVDNPSIDPATGLVLGGGTTTIPDGTVSSGGQATAIRPGDIVVTLPQGVGFGFGFSDASLTTAIQSFSFSMDLGREALRALGIRFRYGNEINFPLRATFSMEVLVRELQDANLNAFLCADGDLPPIDIALYTPACDNNGNPIRGSVAMHYQLRGARYGGTTNNNGVGNGETATLNYSIAIGGPNDTVHGLFMAGVNLV